MRIQRLLSALLLAVAVLSAYTKNANGQDSEDAATRLSTSSYENAILSSSSAEDLEDVKDALFDELIFDFVSRDRIDVVRSLLDKGLAPDVRNRNGQTLLHLSAWNQSNEILAMLIEQSDSVDLPDASGRSPLTSATLSNNVEGVRLLLEAGADIEGLREEGSPLLAAAWSGYDEVFDVLLRNGADTSRLDSDGNTAMHKAVWQGNVGIVQKLLTEGVDLRTTNAAGMTPLDVARARIEATGAPAGEGRSWGTEQLIGPPNASAGDDAKAWASRSQDGQDEWLILYYSQPVVPTAIEIYENLAPGAVNEVALFNDKGEEVVVWEGVDPAKPGENGVHVATIVLDTEIQTDKVRIKLASTTVTGWNEVDAVGLIDGDGNKQWAQWADASTCYATGEVPGLNHRVVHEMLVEKLRQ